MAMGVERNSVIQGSYATPRDSVKLEGGLFGTDSVRTETVAPKSEKLREALASVKLFFQSLFGMKVSTADTEPTDRTSGTKHLMSAMTKANPKLDDILLASAKLVDVGGFNTDALATHNRLDEGAAEGFKSQLKDMTDSQLKRLASTFDQASGSQLRSRTRRHRRQQGRDLRRPRDDRPGHREPRQHRRGAQGTEDRLEIRVRRARVQATGSRREGATGPSLRTT